MKQSLRIAFVILAVFANYAYGQVDFKDDLDAKAYRSFNVFVEACVLGHTGRAGRIKNIDSHPMFKKMPVPEGSNAASSGRLVWAAPPDIFIILDQDMQCSAVISDEAIKDKIAKFVENTAVGKSGGKQNKFVPVTFLSETELDDLKSKNLTAKTYLLHTPKPGMGVYLTLQISITSMPKTYPIKITAAYVQIDEKKLNAK